LVCLQKPFDFNQGQRGTIDPESGGKSRLSPEKKKGGRQNGRGSPQPVGLEKSHIWKGGGHNLNRPETSGGEHKKKCNLSNPKSITDDNTKMGGTGGVGKV